MPRMPPPFSLEDVLRRERQYLASVAPDRHGAAGSAAAEDYAGLALSGSGTRASAFGLGVLQGLAVHGLLGKLDYLSSTGGASSIAGWLAAWIRIQGHQQVEDELREAASNGFEAPEIRALRDSVNDFSANGLAKDLGTFLSWILNVVVNVLTIAAVLAGSLLLYNFVHEYLSDRDDTFLFNYMWVAPALIAVSTMLLAIISRSSEQDVFSNRWLLWAFALSVALALAGAVFFYLTMLSINRQQPYEAAFFGAAVLVVLQFVAWHPRANRLKVFVFHAGSAIAAGAVGGLLLFVLFNLSVWRGVSPERGASAALIMMVGGATVLAYAFCARFWTSRDARYVVTRFGVLLFGIGLFFLIAAWVWNGQRLQMWTASTILVLTIPLAGLIVFGGLCRSVGVDPRSRPLQIFLDLLQELAPYAFLVGLVLVVSVSVYPLLQEAGVSPLLKEARRTNWPLLGVGVGTLLLLVGFVLVTLKGANQLTVNDYQHKRLAHTYLRAALKGRPDASTPDNDLPIHHFLASGYEGPYPLFATGVNIAPFSESDRHQSRRLPFLFSPLASGFEDLEGRTKRHSSVYRPSSEFFGGVSLAAAMATGTGPVRGLAAPPNAAVAFLCAVFDVQDGRWMGNPARDDTWEASGPLIGVGYTARQWFGELPGEPAFIRPFGTGFDTLGMFELIRRRCRHIIVCDANKDPRFAFEDLSATIRKCRTELGIRIEIDPAPLVGRAKAAPNHCQIGTIRYPDDDTGLLLYLKPVVSGDEPADVTQYAAAHPEFPSDDDPAGRFEDATFENYRLLGQHTVQSLLGHVGDQTPASMSVEQVFRAIRRHLQPDVADLDEPRAVKLLQLPENPPPDLIDAITSQECVLCAGPGLAAQAGLPTWSAFLGGLLQYASEAGKLESGSATALASSLSAGELDVVADDLSHQVDRDLVAGYMRSALFSSQPSRAHELLARMPFAGAVNINFDNLLERSFQARGGGRLLVPGDTGELLAALQSKQFFLLNANGVPSQPSSLLFTTRELRALLSANLPFRQIMTTLFVRSTVFFVGSGIDGIREYLDAMELSIRPERRHYAIVAHSGPPDAIKLRYLERTYNLRVISYQAQLDYSELPEFLARLLAAVSEKAPRTKSSSPQILKSVTLENIGPFLELHLDLTSSWNLLLGDNGVGKTVILRAIAAALCGEDVEPATVQRLLRSGATHGTIRLNVEGRNFVVELKRDADGNVIVVSSSLSPLKYDNWLVLGFPALRAIPWERPKGPSEMQSRAPSAKDLLPILRGEPDTRIVELKQWLINLDYRAKSEAQPSRSRQLLNDFFQVLQALTPDLRVELDSIDINTMAINIKTDAGAVVPLEAISQGTGSVMCWIGTLLERLSEAGEHQQPTQNSALVLIDEIDAHMHPKWQQLFVEAFREQFKNVQVIATTHSPLFVGSMKENEIWLVHRAPLKSELYGTVRVNEPADGIRELDIIGPEPDPDEGEPQEARKEKTYRIPAGAKLAVEDNDIVEERGLLTKSEVLVAERIRMRPEGLRADQILTSPLFNLETTRDAGTKKLLSEYTHLTGLDERSQPDEARLADVASQLRIRMPAPQEQEAARKAYSLIEEFAKERMTRLSPGERRKVLDEVKTQLTESITGAGRPE